jgi:hypothetical protein
MKKLKGYKEAKVYVYYYKASELDPESKSLVEHEIYDEEGNIIIKEKIWRRDRYRSKVVYKYNYKSFLIEEQDFYDGEPQYITKYEYNDKDKKFKTQYFEYSDDGEELKHIIKYEYNDKGLVTGKIEYDPQGKIINKAVYEYNDKDNVIELQNFEGEKLEYTTKYEYNDKGLIAEETEYDTQGEIINKAVFEYNDNGDVIELQNFEGEKLEYIIKYKYNDKGVLIEETEYETIDNEQSEPRSTLVYEYE